MPFTLCGRASFGVLFICGCGHILAAGEGATAAGSQLFSGRVVSQSGAPLPGAEVTWGGGAPWAAGADGRFVVPGDGAPAAAGQLGVLALSAPGHAAIYRALAASPGSARELGDIPLRPSNRNLDSANEPDNGGCVRGRAWDACRPATPLANTAIQLWLLSEEEVDNLHAQTDVGGNYCIPVPLVDWVIGQGQASQIPC